MKRTVKRSFSSADSFENLPHSFKWVNYVDTMQSAFPVYVSTFGMTAAEKHIFVEGQSKSYLVYTDSGSGRAEIAGKTQICPRGSLLYIPANEKVLYYNESTEPWRTYWITFGGRAVTSILQSASCVFDECDYAFVRDNILQMYAHREEPDFVEYISSLMYYTLLRIQRIHPTLLPQILPTDSLRARLAPSMKYMVEHFHQDIPLPTLAKISGVGVEYYCRLFKKLNGVRPVAYLNQLRIGHACDLLVAHPEKSVEEIGLLCGFQSSTYFITTFKHFVGEAPGSYRRMQNAGRKGQKSAMQGQSPTAPDVHE